MEPSSVDEQKTKQLCDALRGGADLQTASHFAGLNVQTVYRWLELGQRENERLERGEPADASASAFLELWLQMRKARADAVMRNVAQIQKAANQGEWKAAAWWLERQLPDSFG
jgi:hypothetical protein